MEDLNEINEILSKLDQLDQRQSQLQKELTKLRVSILELKDAGNKREQIQMAAAIVKSQAPSPTPTLAEKIDSLKDSKKVNVPPFDISQPKEKTPIEEFIGTNLLNKVGILILLLGISYGVKYSIDHDLIDPVTRIVLGYFAGLAMVLVGLKLKANYKTFSAVILSGGMASMYFVTYAAYDFYALLPQGLAFAMMVLFTVLTVIASLRYDQMAVAIIGLVGAYGIPFLLNDGSGNAAVLFSYITIVNFGILVLAFKKTWRELYYVAFSVTWLIFAGWHFNQFQVANHLWLSLSFSTIFFITFYAVFIAYKLIQAEPFSIADLVVVLTNSFVYFGFGYSTISDHAQGELFLGLFTVFNSLLHIIACLLVFNKKETLREIFYLVGGMAIVFLTLAVPVQLNGHWVTLIWTLESVLLFWIGRTKTFPVFERLSYVLVLLSVGSLFDDWKNYDLYSPNHPELFVRMLFNVQFMSSAMVILSLGLILKLNFTKEFQVPSKDEFPVVSWVLSILFLMVLYFSMYKEIFTFWQQSYIDSQVTASSGNGGDSYALWDNDLFHFRTLFLLIYSAIFGIVLTLVNQHQVKSDKLALVCAAFNVLILFLFVARGLVSLAELRSSYLLQTDAQFYVRDFKHIAIRYASYMTVVPLLLINRQNAQGELFKPTIKIVEIILFHLFILTVLSSELVNWLELAHVHDGLKLGLSILWSGYALLLIVLGLKHQSRPLRIMAFALFSITIAKLFLYDIADLSTIAKTIVMIILGVLLLVASFLYNRVKKSADEKTG